METQLVTNNMNPTFALDPLMTNEIMTSAGNLSDDYRNLFQQLRLPWLKDLLTKLTTPAGKKSFLVFKNNKYINVPTENIAFFYIKFESPVIMCFDKQEYFLNYSLDQIQNLLSEKQFYRLNRQYLINFNAVKEVEHYFARKLLVNPVIPMKDKLIVSKEKVTEFLRWLDNR
ncbi:MAG TPA: LytTR family DNA-binding domain-containing protein [Chitinophagaceae bacterium]|nr:LytTR family DNA-binding domain-containing protein [Chitinophagaceae bacterium]